MVASVEVVVVVHIRDIDCTSEGSSMYCTILSTDTMSVSTLMAFCTRLLSLVVT